MRGGWVKHVTSKGKMLLQRVEDPAAMVAAQLAAAQSAAAQSAAAPSAIPPGSKMLAAVPTPYFSNYEQGEMVGVLTPGTLIDVQDSATDSTGKTMVRHTLGWSPRVAPDGTAALNLAPAPSPSPAAFGRAEEGVPPASFGAGSLEPGGPPPGEPMGLPPNSGGGMSGMGGGGGLAVVQEDKKKLIPSEGVLKVGWIMKSSGGKKAADGAELVQIIEQWQQRLFTLGKDVEGVPVMCWYKTVEQYKQRTPSNPNTGSFLTLTTARAEVVTTGDMKNGATLEDDAKSAAKRASGSSDLRSSQSRISVNSKQFVIITPQRNLKCEVIDPNDTAQEWVDMVNSIAIDGAIASSGQKRFSLARKLSQKTM